MTTQRSTKSVCSIIGFALFAMMIIYLGSTAVISYIITNNNPYLLYYSSWAIWLLNDVPLYALGLPVFLLIMHLIKDGPDTPRDTHKLGAGKFLLVLVFCLGVTYASNYITIIFQLIMVAIFGSDSSVLANDALTMLVTSGGILPVFIFGCIVPAVGEEFMFRFMIRKKMRGASDLTYILFSALCFSVFHVNIGQMLYAFLLGVVFAWLYLYTGKIWIPMLGHLFVNTMGMVIAPRAVNSVLGTVIIVVLVLGSIVASIVLFVMYHKKFVLSFMPPTEEGWPYAPSRRQMRYLAQQEAQDAGVNPNMYAHYFANVQPPSSYPYGQAPQSYGQPGMPVMPNPGMQQNEYPQNVPGAPQAGAYQPVPPQAAFPPPQFTPHAAPYGGAGQPYPYTPQQPGQMPMPPMPQYTAQPVPPMPGVQNPAFGQPNYPAQKSGAAKWCLVNGGMLTYLIFGFIATVFSFISVLLG